MSKANRHQKVQAAPELALLGAALLLSLASSKCDDKGESGAQAMPADTYELPAQRAREKDEDCPGWNADDKCQAGATSTGARAGRRPR